MGELCELILEKDLYYPGETINGKVVCHFLNETEVKGIRAIARGRAKVFWKEGHSNVYHAEEEFFLKESELAGETTFSPGFYDYPFTFTLPNPLPSSMFEELGNVRYSVLATVERAWTMNYECKKVFTVFSGYDVNGIDELKKPFEVTEEKRPFSLFDEPGPITINVKLPTKGYVPSQTFPFSVKITNNSNVNVERIHFTPVQGFEFNVKENTKTIDSFIGEELEPQDSALAAGNEKSWNLKFNIPSDIFNGNLNGCGIINIFWELRNTLFAAALNKMGEECNIFLESESYYPGQIINGRVECNFLSENKVRGIRIRFKGRAKVHWTEGRYSNYSAKETYFKTESDLLGETVILEGQHKYPFSFNLPFLLPPSVNHAYGDIKYTVQTTIDRPWTINRKFKRTFVIYSFTDLNHMEDIKKPEEITKIKHPFSIFNESGPIAITVKLPAIGYVQSEKIYFSANVKNDSRIAVRRVYFKIAQRFEFYCKFNMKGIDAFVGQKHATVDGSVAAGSEKWFDFAIRVPSNMHNGDLNVCTIIKSYVELRGKVILPLPHKNLKITIPIILGNIALVI